MKFQRRKTKHKSKPSCLPEILLGLRWGGSILLLFVPMVHYVYVSQAILALPIDRTGLPKLESEKLVIGSPHATQEQPRVDVYAALKRASQVNPPRQNAQEKVSIHATLEGAITPPPEAPKPIYATNVEHPKPRQCSDIDNMPKAFPMKFKMLTGMSHQQCWTCLEKI